MGKDTPNAIGRYRPGFALDQPVKKYFQIRDWICLFTKKTTLYLQPHKQKDVHLSTFWGDTQAANEGRL